MADVKLRVSTDNLTEITTGIDVDADLVRITDVDAGLEKKSKIRYLLGDVLRAIRSIASPADDDFLQWKSGAPTNRNLHQVRTDVHKPAAALTDDATIATDASLGAMYRVTLGGNRTLGNPTNAFDGQRLTWEIIQDATGSRTLAYDTKFAFGTDITGATLTTTANKRDFLTAIYNAGADKFYVVEFKKGY